MPRIITTREEVLALRPGTLLVDRDGLPMTRTHEGEFALWVTDEGRWVYYDVDELTGVVPFGEESRFLPLTVPDEDPTTWAETSRAILATDADPEVWLRVAWWELEGARWTPDPEVRHVLGLVPPGETRKALVVMYPAHEGRNRHADWEVDEEALMTPCSEWHCDALEVPGKGYCPEHRLELSDLTAHFVAHHEETEEDLEGLVEDARADHPGRDRLWLLDLIHNRQHTSLDWDAGHPESVRRA
jgi:hypothetical protein